MGEPARKLPTGGSWTGHLAPDEEPSGISVLQRWVERADGRMEGLGKIDVARIPWLEGRIQAGLGHPREARRLLAEARQKFEGERMHYDAALALLEEAGLLLDEGRTAEVKALTPALAKVFESKGVHREALAALQTFQEAVEQDAATAELTRRILRFLFRARFDEDVKLHS